MTTVNVENFEIHVKGGFSERKGIKHFSDIVQTNNLNKRTRNRLYSATDEMFEELGSNHSYQINLKDYFVEYLYKDVFSKTVRDIPMWGNDYDYDRVFDLIYVIFEKYDYTDVFTFIEGIIRFLNITDKVTYYSYNYKKEYIESISNIFKHENVNYRVINDLIIDIVNEEEIKAIEETLENKYDVVRKHYSKAIEKLYKDKDYSNSIKESISSVEAMCQIINGTKETLGKALNSLKIQIHPALKSAYSNIYGYTSDENGTRHANGIGEKSATFSEAKYMLISCSAFVNYLKENFEEGK